MEMTCNHSTKSELMKLFLWQLMSQNYSVVQRPSKCQTTKFCCREYEGQWMQNTSFFWKFWAIKRWHLFAESQLLFDPNEHSNKIPSYMIQIAKKCIFAINWYNFNPWNTFNCPQHTLHNKHTPIQGLPSWTGSADMISLKMIQEVCTINFTSVKQ